MLPYPLSNFEKQKYYQNEPIFNGVYSRDNLPEHKSLEIKDWNKLCNQSWWILWYWNSLGCFVCAK